MRLLALALALMLLPCLAGAAEERTLRHDGRDRRYILELPDAPGPRPAIVVFHGAAGSASGVRGHTRISLSDEGWIEVYPQAVGGVWSDGVGALSGGLLARVDDLGFVHALVGRLVAEGQVDPDRIFFTGLSNGGAMALAVLCQAPELVAGAAVHVMTQPVGLDCPPGPPVPLMFVLGTHDPLIPFGGGVIAIRGRDPVGVHSAEATVAFHAERNRCEARSERALPDRDPNDGTRVRLVEYRGCAAPLMAFVVEGGGHSWAGANPAGLLGQLLGRASRDISATAETQAFFRRLAAEGE